MMLWPFLAFDSAGAQDERPPGWDNNPSTWRQRMPIVGAAVVGVLIASYMGLYQIGVLRTVWDPFFGAGTLRVLDSSLSTVLPIPDAWLGAFGYLIDAVAGVIGGTGRWRTMPWIVVLFGLAVGPLGVVSIALVMAQPLVVGAWCTLCLATAVISLVMIGPAFDEVLASLQYLRQVRDEQGLGMAWWAFWGAGVARRRAKRTGAAA